MFMIDIMIDALTAMNNAAIPILIKFNGMHYTYL